MQIANRESFAVASRKRGMIPVEYIEGTGTQWIDTRLGNHRNPSNTSVYGMRVEASVAWTHVPTTREVICGLYKTGSDDFLLFSADDNPARWGRANGGDTTTVTAFAITANSRVRVVSVLTSGYSSLGVDGVADARAVTINLTGLPDFPVLAVRSAVGVARFAHARIYSFQMRSPWASTWERDFIPVRVGRVGYLYDQAHPTGGPNGDGLYGSETTPLVVGPDVY